MNDGRVNGILGRNKAWERASMDSDKDGVSNVLDCKPHNPREQGIIHRLGRGAVRSVTKPTSGIRKKLIHKINVSEEKSEEKKKYKEKQEAEIKKASDEAYYAEKKKVAMQKARDKARSGGFLGSIGRAFDSATKPAVAKRIVRTTKSTKKKGKSKRKAVPRSTSKKEFGGFDFTKLKSLE